MAVCCIAMSAFALVSAAFATASQRFVRRTCASSALSLSAIVGEDGSRGPGLSSISRQVGSSRRGGLGAGPSGGNPSGLVAARSHPRRMAAHEGAGEASCTQAGVPPRGAEPRRGERSATAAALAATTLALAAAAASKSCAPAAASGVGDVAAGLAVTAVGSSGGCTLASRDCSVATLVGALGPSPAKVVLPR